MPHGPPVGVDFGADGAAFTFVESPRLHGCSPPQGPAVGGTVLAVTGAGFDSGVACVMQGVAWVIEGRQEEEKERDAEDADGIGGGWGFGV